MAHRIVFKSDFYSNQMYEEEYFDFTYFNGFAVSQKQKSINSLHQEIKKKYPNSKVLEISTKSNELLGVKLSAFNLMLQDEELGMQIHLENVFQSAKVFEFGGPYDDLKTASPKDAKRDIRLQNSGKLICFRYDNKDWELIPKTMFYDWIYMKALNTYFELKHEIMKYDIFTDIEFNDKRSLNCQARSAALFVSLTKRGSVSEVLKDLDKFKKIYEVADMQQLSLF